MTGTAARTLGLLTDGLDGRLSVPPHEVAFPAGARIFDEGRPADRFWILLTGRVALDIEVPGGPPPVVETLGPGDLLGWSWFFPPHVWHLGAVSVDATRVLEYDAVAVRSLCEQDPALGYRVARAVGAVVGERLKATRIRLLDLYGPRVAGGLGTVGP
ncbi:cyclic nucleotide-binding domain-containing protein [Peterkaempfera griseoplana]|uniref:cyclic nucleotide-binding domain-containing protein n=1 Tax=Peterkaempfera griseoplana TaxID=66896 RepID=UPI0007C6EFC4|nr:cyclic nucleotide-binding domain-containing protein [Peterkaempfera griseoplana]